MTTPSTLPAQGGAATAWLREGRMVNAFPWPARSPEAFAKYDHDGYWRTKGYSEAPLYDASTVAAVTAALRDSTQALASVCLLDVSPECKQRALELVQANRAALERVGAA